MEWERATLTSDPIPEREKSYGGGPKRQAYGPQAHGIPLTPATGKVPERFKEAKPNGREQKNSLSKKAP